MVRSASVDGSEQRGKVKRGMAADTDQTVILNMATRRGIGFVLGTLIAYTKDQATSNDPKRDDTANEAHRRGWQQDTQALEDAKSRLRH